MTPDERALIKALGESLVVNFCNQAIVVFLFGFFVPLGILSLQTSVRTHAHRYTAFIVLCGVLSATCTLIVTFGMVIIFIRFGMMDNIGTPIAEKATSTDQRVYPWNEAAYVLQLLPLLVNDALIIWRAWIIFSKRRWALCILAILWLTTAGAIFGSIVTVSKSLFNSLEYVSFGLTLGTNIVATSFIGYTIWEYCKVFKTFKKKSRVWKVLILLFEIGFIYCLLQVVSIVSLIFTTSASAIQQSITQKTLTNALFTTCTMLSALYPIIVAMVIQGPSLMLGMHESISLIREDQINMHA